MFTFSIFGRNPDGSVPSGTLLGRLLSLVKASIQSNTTLSPTHLSAFFVLFSSLFYSVTFVVIEIANAAMALMQGQRYVPSNESIIVLGMLLSHHLGIMFSKPSAYKPHDPVVLQTTETTSRTSRTTQNQMHVEEYDEAESEAESAPQPVSRRRAVKKKAKVQAEIEEVSEEESEGYADQI